MPPSGLEIGGSATNDGKQDRIAHARLLTEIRELHDAEVLVAMEGNRGGRGARGGRSPISGRHETVLRFFPVFSGALSAVS
jgi:hypothetical protein